MGARNLLIPFRRDRKRDLATGEAEALLVSKVRQVLLTEGATARSSGELPWRTNFGAGLGLARHRSNDAVLHELARVHVREALARWLPRVRLTAFTAEPSGSLLILRIAVEDGDATASVQVDLYAARFR